MKITMRIVLSCFVLSCLSCAEEGPAPTSTMQAAVESADVAPATCGIFFGSSALEADARSRVPGAKPDAVFAENEWSTGCVDAIVACQAIHAREAGRFCQVGSSSGMSVDGIGTSPSGPEIGMPFAAGGDNDDDPAR